MKDVALGPSRIRIPSPRLAMLEDTAFLSAFRPELGQELWISDGSKSGTHLLKDLIPGTDDGAPTNLTPLDGMIFFFAWVGTEIGCPGLWKSDGTPEGTVLVRELHPQSGSCFAVAGNLTTVGERLFFTLLQPLALPPPPELWTSDGTPEGTRRLDVFVSDLFGVVAGLDGLLFFPGTESTRDELDPETTGLWRSDGTPEGTRLIHSLSITGSELSAVGGRIFFTATDPVTGIELWVSDGTPEGTRLLKDIAPGEASSHPRTFTRGDGTLFFSADDGATGRELWKSDGTPEGTLRVKDVNPGTTSSITFSSRMVYSDGTLFFNADDGTHGSQVWASNGTESGTFRATGLPPGSTSLEILTRIESKLFLTAEDSTTRRRELWWTEGTPGSTEQVTDPQGHTLFPPSLPHTSGESFFAEFQGDLLFFASSEVARGFSLWRSDGRPEGTRLVKPLTPGASSHAEPIADVFGRLVFVASEESAGRELWRSDGTQEGTTLLADVRVGAESGIQHQPFRSAGSGGFLFFQADDGMAGKELWRTDGTSDGTVLVKDIAPGAASSNPNQLTDMDGTLFFIAADDSSRPDLWRSDGSAEGTVVVQENEVQGELTPINGMLFFAGRHGLWRSDGTSGGTERVPLNRERPSVAFRDPRELTNVAGRLFFVAADEPMGLELWTTDALGQVGFPVKDILPGSGSSDPKHLAEVGELVLFAADDGVHGRELWRSDGTEAGTKLVKDIRPGPNDSDLRSFTTLGDVLLFVADDRVRGRELWSSDGTEGGTILHDIAPGPISSNPGFLRGVNGLGFFSANDRLTGEELWVSDGTEAGTRLLADIADPGGSVPRDFAEVDGLLFFRALGPGVGEELWAIPFPVPEGSLELGLGVAAVTFLGMKKRGRTRPRFHPSP